MKSSLFALLAFMVVGAHAQAEEVLMQNITVHDANGATIQAQLTARSMLTMSNGKFMSDVRVKMPTGQLIALSPENEISLPEMLCAKLAPQFRFQSITDSEARDQVRAVLQKDKSFRLAGPGEMVGNTSNYTLDSIGCTEISGD